MFFRPMPYNRIKNVFSASLNETFLFLRSMFQDRLVVGRFAVALPLLVFGGLSIMSAILSLWLPETLHKPIPDTVDDAKLVGR